MRVKPSAMDRRFYCSKACMAQAYKTRLTGAGNPNYRDAGWRACRWCNKNFKSYSKTIKFCTRECARLFRTDGKPKQDRSPHHRKPRLCKWCNTNALQHHRKVCDPCIQKWKLKIRTERTRVCVVCNNVFVAPSTSTTRITCSDLCSKRWMSIRQRGDKSHLWKGGKTSSAMILRTSAEYADWRMSVFSRDGFRCAICGSRGQIHAHHKKSFSEYPELRLDVNNGITVCHKCHSDIDPKAKNLVGKKRRTILMANIISHLESRFVHYIEASPSIYFAINGSPFCILVAPSSELSDEQKSTLELMAANGWKTHVCRSYQEFVEALGAKEK